MAKRNEVIAEVFRKELKKHRIRYVSPFWILLSETRMSNNAKLSDFSVPWTYVLNLNSFDAYIEIRFYDNKGVEYRDMRKGKTLRPNETMAHMPDDRLVLNGEARLGWYEVLSNAPVMVTGEIISKKHGVSERSGESSRTLVFFEA